MSDKPKRELLPGEAEVDAWIDTLGVLAEFKPGYIINEPLNMIEVHFEDVAHKSVPLIEGVYHWIDKLVAFDDGRVVGLNFWIYKPPRADAMSDDRRKSLIVGNLPEATVAALKDATMSDDTEKLLRDVPTVSGLLERFIANAIANARDEAAAEIERLRKENRKLRYEVNRSSCHMEIDAMTGIALILLLAILMWCGILYVVSLGNMMHWWYL